MPSMDFETFIALAIPGDRKVACETTLPSKEINNTITTTKSAVSCEMPLSVAAEVPAESFRLTPEQLLDWIDRNGAPIYERENSTKGPSNPKSHHPTPNPVPSAAPSQRFSGNLKRKDPIIGLPRKLRVDHSGVLGQSSRRTGHLRFRKAAVSGSEPVSPKVSCLGKVLSDRERRGAKTKDGAPVPARKRGFFARIFRVVACGGRSFRRESFEEVETESRRSVETREEEETPRVPGLGAMRKFTSGRSWASMEAEEVERSGPLDGEIRRRRGAESLEVETARGSGDVGPASV